MSQVFVYRFNTTEVLERHWRGDQAGKAPYQCLTTGYCSICEEVKDAGIRNAEYRNRAIEPSSLRLDI